MSTRVPEPAYLKMSNYKFTRPGAGNLVYGSDADAYERGPYHPRHRVLWGVLIALAGFLALFTILMKV